MNEQRVSQGMEPSNHKPLLEARELRKNYRRGTGVFAGQGDGQQFVAVDGVSLSVVEGETFAPLMKCCNAPSRNTCANSSPPFLRCLACKTSDT